ncbi:MAG: type II toxin-antitoxin system RelE/ParE family toxin [Pirellulales bacterium]
MKLRVLSTAEAEATDAACWYDDQSIGLGELFLAEYAAALSAIEVDPLRFSLLETEPTGRFRRCILRRFPYAVIFEVLFQEILVLAVAHTSRRPGYWRDRE